ncbi:SprT family protein [Latilactobacillus curvatus]|uniref:Protein SprT-like n=1 Tax=Latilactobacillus curvatus JCM 1096 = DSM 20019 TaxID=1293592 RepID=A0AAJ0PBW3_LATCU|nr:SprT family protein [Latilactobacillus curvatus]KRK90419.1 metallopeptidase family protein [Latilactobacillus curvatus JCM 1096 = DSM 20019]MCT3531323.1 SprT family protein [Latilactobacillus curvatus]MDG2988574.1 SprT family protein [Latilactobacillus curvatus]QAS49957.1 SprT family protein [Latilactobacillus curvatus JCM 1096 = DSM 20019]GED82036.1 protein SprT [Latilactobacillus curvatus]
MTDQALTELIERLSLQFFNRPFVHQANLNRRLKTTGGRYHLQDHHIDINPKMLTEHDTQTLEGVIKHELCHYHLHLLHRGYRHRDAEFKQLLAQVGGARYAPAAQKTAKSSKIVIYKCSDCGQVYPRRRRMNTARYVCRRCHGRLIYQTTQIQ